MSTYTCPHCGERGLSTQRRHWCPKAPPISQLLRLGPPRSRDPIANEYIASLTRELEAARAALTIAETTAANLHDTIRLRDRELAAARELIRDLVDDEDAGLVWLGRRLVCAYCTADGLYSVAHAADCPIIRARRALVADTEVSDGGI